MTNEIEYYDQIHTISKKNMKTKKRWDDVIGQADDYLWQRKYKESKQREQEKTDARNLKNQLRLEKTQAVKPIPGKKAMVKKILNTQRKEKMVKKEAEIDPDILKYFGRDVNLDDIKSESDIENRGSYAQ